ncbi:MAG: Sensor histidine kinase RcsC [Chroococcopsis gigantea SAG 12.99]|jgi:signal transduction histidine kinase|nr:HAMP domain-containing histidine kinase [Chlorogloea purpurea SAG 13.99]MDV3002349.1 Sensor histidine kinase RcsC [Chroococcopsis gigantea SAG 12.99]
MQGNKLFNRTRIHLALWYSGVMGVIFSAFGYGVYQAIAHAHLVTLDRELESIAKTLHNTLELKLTRTGKLDAIIGQLLPDLCVNNAPCFSDLTLEEGNTCPINYSSRFNVNNSPSHHLFKFIGGGEYYLRLLNLQQCPLAFAGNPPPLKEFSLTSKYLSLTDDKGNRYHEISLLLHTVNQEDWGYLQLGRSLKDFDEYMLMVRWILFLGLPVAIASVGISSWWLAGLAMKPIYQSYQQIQQFTADAAHELKTPLAAMGATLEATTRRQTTSTTEIKELLAILSRQNHRLTAIVKDLLLLSRLERQSLGKKTETCCLNDVVNDLVEELAALALSAKVDLTAKEPGGQAIYIKGDLEQIYRLISNLMINAIQYTPSGGKVRAILEATPNEAIIKIEDTGIGISKREQELIFDRFYRVNSDRSRQTGGSGLGLAIALALVQYHRGNISVNSQLGKGSSFIVRFPRYLA